MRQTQQLAHRSAVPAAAGPLPPPLSARTNAIPCSPAVAADPWSVAVRLSQFHIEQLAAGAERDLARLLPPLHAGVVAACLARRAAVR